MHGIPERSIACTVFETVPGVHILVAGCTDFGTCALARCILFQYFEYNFYELMDVQPGACFLKAMHPAGA